MNWLKALIALFSLSLISGCGTQKPNFENSDIVSVSKVVKQIKEDIATFNAYTASHAQDTKVPPCNSNINFFIKQVTVQLITKEDNAGTSSAGLVIPIGIGTFETGISSSSDLSNSRTVTFNLYSKNVSDSKTSSDNDDINLKSVDASFAETAPIGSFPITASLRELRVGLQNATASSKNGACLALSNKKAEANTLEFAITSLKENKVSGGINFAIVSIGANQTQSKTFGNVITVKFMALPGSFSAY